MPRRACRKGERDNASEVLLVIKVDFWLTEDSACWLVSRSSALAVESDPRLKILPAPKALPGHAPARLKEFTVSY